MGIDYTMCFVFQAVEAEEMGIDYTVLCFPGGGGGGDG